MSRNPIAALAAMSIVVLAGCTAGATTGTPPTPTVGTSESSSQSTTASSTAAAPTSPASSSRVARPSSSPAHLTPTPRSSSATVPVSTSTHPVIVIDPGHSVTVSGTDPATGLNVADYENEPEMRDVWSVALLVQAKLEAAGYRVILTKKSLYAPTNLGTRADIANAAHAALALSIHDQAGSNGGIPFATGNNNVYYQSVGDYRVNPEGKKVVFTNSAVAAVSKRYGEIFQAERAAVEGHSVRLLGNTGYDVGSRGLQAGDIWIVQLLSKVPWIYNEAGGNSPGQSGLDSTDMNRYADGLVASVERCVPIQR